MYTISTDTTLNDLLRLPVVSGLVAEQTIIKRFAITKLTFAFTLFIHDSSGNSKPTYFDTLHLVKNLATDTEL